MKRSAVALSDFRNPAERIIAPLCLAVGCATSVMIPLPTDAALAAESLFSFAAWARASLILIGGILSLGVSRVVFCAALFLYGACCAVCTASLSACFGAAARLLCLVLFLPRCCFLTRCASVRRRGGQPLFFAAAAVLLTAAQYVFCLVFLRPLLLWNL